MSRQYDVVVIGSGVVGSSIAYHLSERKTKKVAVIDKGFILTGTSGSTQAWVWVHNKTPSWYGELSMYSAELYPTLKKRIGDVEYKRTGGIAPFFDEKDREHALRLAEMQEKVGIDVKVLTREELLEKEPFLSEKAAGATYSDIDGNVNPFRLVELYTKAAKKNGVDFSFYNPVTEIRRDKGYYQIRTEKEGVFTAKQIVLAGGVWTGELGRMLDITIPVKQVRGQILVTEPLEPFIQTTIAGVRQAENGEVLIGYSKEEVGYNRQTTLDVMQETAGMALDYFPVLAEANVVRCFSGVRVIPKDGLPILGQIPGMENAYVAVTHSGVTLSPLIGTLMTELVMDRETSLDLSKMSLSRFERSAAGELIV
ncbi:NAD(P)/FAD-dependent oxidoreductase [Edaphobacillus lindanitolerans]|uniref:Sarcosine oxidase subunit beta n=1 Tax=Edaphobacillus lindanitolerans TaxID=550447 RepID=A0A1U7PNG0_9BACI|nr:FAD-dependent oxidoreductase [Edaphobacillus lindanitolerans]SIT73244.1 sarcosine oxidase subunit beta [Edaphobacillus lindanitolerans]